MAARIGISLLKSLGLTLCLELGAGALLGVRRKRDLLLIALGNVLTNPLVGLILDGIYLASREMPAWYIFLGLELGVVAVEGLLYQGRLEWKKWNVILFSGVLNGISCLGGWILS